MSPTYCKTARIIYVLLLSSSSIWADVSYQETTQMTGGAMLGMMKVAGAFARSGHKPTDPIQTTVAVKGNRMIRKSPDTSTITDLDKQTITTVNFSKKTYSVMTFDQMRQMLEQMSDKAKSKDAQNVDMSLDIKLNDPGQTKTVEGLEAREMIMTMTMSGTDTQTGQTGAMNIVTDMWLARDLPGADELRDFNQRMGHALGFIPTGAMSRPELGKAMAEIYKQGSKLNGVPVENVMKMGMAGQPASGTPAGDPKVANASDTSNQSQSQPNSVGGAMASALGQHFGFGRKKKQDTAANDNGSSGAPSGSSPDSLIEMTSRSSHFSTGSVDTSLFEVPADFSQVEEDINSRRRGH